MDPLIPVSVEEHNALMIAVGEALSNWTRIELEIDLVFGMVSRIQDSRRVGAITEGIVSFILRLSLCDRLIEMEDLTEIESEMWARLSAKIQKLYKKRHEIAHFHIVATPREGKLATPMVSPFFSYEKWMMEKAKYLSVDQIQERGEKFGEAAAAVNWFIYLLGEKISPELYPMPDNEEPPLIPQLRDSAVRILEERKRSSALP